MYRFGMSPFFCVSSGRIARNMAALNGAELTLTNREEGGLCAQVRFLRR